MKLPASAAGPARKEPLRIQGIIGFRAWGSGFGALGGLIRRGRSVYS